MTVRKKLKHLLYQKGAVEKIDGPVLISHIQNEMSKQGKYFVIIVWLKILLGYEKQSVGIG